MGPYALGLTLALIAAPLVAFGATLFARKTRAGQYIRAEGPARHANKAGTPTMGGVVPLTAIAIGVGVMWAAAAPLTPQVGFALAAAAASGLIGLVDDILSQRRRTNLGLTVPQKLALETAAAAALFAMTPALPDMEFAVPFSNFSLVGLPGWATFLLLLCAFLGTTNAVNLTDGLDGLATGASLIALLGLLLLVWNKVDLALLTLIGIGAYSGMLWVNFFPASIFLGDVGSMGLGGLIFGIAFAGGTIFALPIIGGLFVLEALSVILQVASYKLTGVRLFKMSPLHHHLEEGLPPWPHFLQGREWPEPKVVVRLWLLALGFCLLGLFSFLA